MLFPFYPPGTDLVAEDRWHNLLWAAVPQRVISSSHSELITYVPTGAVATRASTRGLPGTENLTRDERKLLALRTRSARVIEALEAPDKLFFYRLNRWSRINLGWDHSTGAFLGWYVNFELPAHVTPTGLATMDLVLDIWVNPDRSWEWKDRGDYLQVLNDGTLDHDIADQIKAETVRVLDEITTQAGPSPTTGWPSSLIPNGPARHCPHPSPGAETPGPCLPDHASTNATPDNTHTRTRKPVGPAALV